MSYTTILVEQKDRICTMLFNRPKVLNAISDDMRFELQHFFKNAAEDKEVRTLIVSGQGRAFSAGADLNVLKQRYQNSQQSGQNDGDQYMLLPKILSSFPKPIIAAVNGPAVGFGATMTLNCDIRLASTEASFCFPFARLGLTPEFCSSYFLPRLIGFGKAAELLYTARTIDANEAQSIGLINRVLSPDELLPEAYKLASQIATFSSRSIQNTKKLLRHGSHSTIDQVIEYEFLTFQAAAKSSEHYESVCRLIQKMKKK